MSRSHVANMHSISSIPSMDNREMLPTPRSVPSPLYGSSAENNNGACTPPLVIPRKTNDHDSRPRDSGVQAIGAFFSTPYDSDYDSDNEEISIPPINSNEPNSKNDNGTITIQPVVRSRSSRAISVSVSKAQAKAHKDALEAKIKSQAGELDDWDNNDNDNDDDYDDEIIEPPVSPAKRIGNGSWQSDESGRVRPLTVVEFPEPTLQPDQGHGKGYPQPPSHNPQRPNGPIRSQSDGPNGSTRTSPSPNRSNTSPSNYHPQPGNKSIPRIDTSNGGLSPPRTIMLPPPSSPISPLLAAPPKPVFSSLSPPSSPFASPSRHGRGGSSSNGSIRGFDVMAEKKALFREGQEELISPFSTRRDKPGRSGLNGKSQTKSAFLASGMDFWKRFEGHVKLDEQERAANKESGKESAWLSKAQERNGRIKKMIWVFLVILIILVVALVAYFVTKPSSEPKAVATSI
ncbi:uncharacterized protein L201_001910 [Kwoniella dendrophila CBS 6074]|uniref:Uncharacterized protein n=1 Tax=Kwoniella dendrophila CBS 6074 TaxID=1295534 RepID=A0AAX4JQB5_9TREE